MRGECLTFPSAVEVGRAERLARIGVDCVGEALLLGCVELPSKDDGCGIRRGAPPGMVDIAHLRIVGIGIAIIAVELPPRRVLPIVTVGADVTSTIVDRSVPEAEHADVTVGCETCVVGKLWRVYPISMQPVKSAVQLPRDRSRGIAVDHIGLEPGRGEK